MRRLSILVALVFAASIVAGLAALDDQSAFAGQRTFVGASKCKTCHKKPENGEQFKIWSEGAHAKAYATLASEEAKKIAEAKGIADPQKADECLSCHVTGHGVAAEFLGTKYDMTEGVTCEGCHGAGGDYYKKKTMMAVTAGDIEAASVGLVKPDAKVCTGCHNDKSPTFKSFDFAAMSKKIAHPIPEGAKRTAASGGDEEE